MHTPVNNSRCPLVSRKEVKNWKFLRTARNNLISFSCRNAKGCYYLLSAISCSRRLGNVHQCAQCTMSFIMSKVQLMFQCKAWAPGVRYDTVLFPYSNNIRGMRVVTLHHASWRAFILTSNLSAYCTLFLLCICHKYFRSIIRSLLFRSLVLFEFVLKQIESRIMSAACQTRTVRSRCLCNIIFLFSFRRFHVSSLSYRQAQCINNNLSRKQMFSKLYLLYNQGCGVYRYLVISVCLQRTAASRMVDEPTACSGCFTIDCILGAVGVLA